MSAEICTSDPDGNNASLQGTTVGGSKPLHRFIKGQPKIMGIVILILGSCFFTISIAVTSFDYLHYTWIAIPPGFLMGALFIISGILYILTEHNTTKKTVTMSLALSIVSILVACWSIINLVVAVISNRHMERHEFIEDNSTETDNPYLFFYEVSVELIFLFYTVVGAVIFIVMSCMAVAALRSTKSQAIIVMTTMPVETPVE